MLYDIIAYIMCIYVYIYIYIHTYSNMLYYVLYHIASEPIMLNGSTCRTAASQRFPDPP